ncbi:HAD-IIIC family phosphatase [Streptomyces sp. NPDC049040]|uniref:HAD-IIIC family phosphatase n=1 Tax=Streptomyces sp. NPDC049040 TaxID=3365593 RepID=UPI00371ECD68
MNAIPTADLLARLRRLRSDGAVPDPELWPAIRELTGVADRAKAGGLLAGLPTRLVTGEDRPLRPLRVGLTGTFTADGLLPLLRTALLAAGIDAEIQLSGYGRLALDLGDPASPLAAFAPDVVLCLLHDEALLPPDPAPTDLAALDRHITAQAEEVGELALGFAARTGATMLLHTVPLSALEYRTLVAQRSRAALGRAWRRANLVLLDLPETSQQVHVLDLETLVANEPVALRDERRYRFARMAWSPGVEDLYATEAAAFCRALAGLTRKVLVLDLDQTLWGGVVGDDGPTGIDLGSHYPGNAYLELQRRALMLRRQGVLLAVCSKNSPEPVAQVFAEHPAMVLRAEDFVAQAVNWSPKDENLRELAHTLNLGLDSMVFLDDSAFECELVRASLPDVAVVRADGDPAEHAARLLGTGLFDVLQLTETDLERTGRYQAEAHRRAGFAEAGSTQAFLGSLGLRVRVREADAYAVPRVHQLLQRTNQFNTTNLRWTESQIGEALASDHRTVLVFDVTDRFGSEDTVGAVLLSAAPQQWTVDNFVMSCRVFSRGIEFAVLQRVAEHAARHGAPRLVADFVPTTRNAPAAAFYQEAGFTPAAGPGHTYELALEPMPRLTPAWIDLEGETADV